MEVMVRAEGPGVKPDGANDRRSNGETGHATAYADSITSNRRFKGDFCCPICGGTDDDKRGQGSRCWGLLSEDGEWAHCTRKEHAGRSPYNPGSQAYPHKLKGKCPCGTEHNPAEPKPSRGKRKGEFDRSYPYLDAAGNVAFEVVRFKNPKGFAQRRPSGGGKWEWNLKGVKLVPYRLPELLAAAPGSTVIVAEGEKDVDALRSLGFAATCNPMGAGKWREEYSDHLAGRHVVILPDNDQPGSEHAQAVAESVQGAGKALSVKVIALPGLPDHGDPSDWIARGGTTGRLREIIEGAPIWVQTAGQHGSTTLPRNAPRRELVEVSPQRHLVLAATLAVLPNDPGLFCRGNNALVKIAEPCAEDTDKLPGGVELRKARGTVRITPMGEAGLSCRLTSVAEFYSWFKDRNGESETRPVHPPPWLVKAVAENSDYPGVRPLEGVAEVPFPRPDGTLVMTPGYDPATGFYYSPSVAIDPIPDRPSQAAAAAAAAVLFGPVDQFPFVGPDDKAVWLAALLSVIARPAIAGPCPGTVFNGNKAGTGKGKLIDAISGIANGRAVPTTAYPRDEDEAEKLKVAFALAGTPIVHFDNIEEGRTYGGGVIDSALTTTACGGRILGLSKNVEGVELRTNWFLSGNNISPVKDASRRWLVCNLVTALERPEERTDLKIPDFLEHVGRHRAALVRAALVILRAHAGAGWPKGAWGTLGSYEQWDRIVRGAVWFATGLDCNATRRKAAEDSPDRLNKLALLEAWKELPNGGPDGPGVTSEEAHRLAFGDKDVPTRYPALADALVRFSRDGKMSSNKIGFIIRGMKGQNINGMTFLKAGELKHSALWAVGEIIPS